MGLSFLNPLFFIGLAGLAVPVLVHLVQSYRGERVRFPSLMFLDRVPFRTIRKSRLRDIWLFLMRCAALVLLVGAFARPLLGGRAAEVVAGAGSRDVVVLLDTSFSMGFGERWDRAVDEARRTFDGLGRTDRGALVRFDEGAEVVAPFTSDRGHLRALLDALEPGDRSTRFDPALDLARQLLLDSELPRREVVLISDMQRNGWRNMEAARLPGWIELDPVDVSEPDHTNLSVASLRLQYRYAAQGSRLTVTARIVNRGQRPSGEKRVSLTLDGRERAERVIEVEEGGFANVEFGDISIPAGEVRGTVSVDHDQLPGDDTFQFAIGAGRRLRVTLVEGPTRSGRGGLYVSRALSIGERPSYELTTVAASRADAGRLASTDLLITDSATDWIESHADEVRDFVERGGGLIVVLGEAGGTDGTGPAADLAPPTGPRALEFNSENGGAFGEIDFDHPVFSVFDSPRGGDLSTARFYRYNAVNGDWGGGVVARFEDGGAALLEQRLGSGRILIWTSTLDTYWNDLALQPVFLPLVHQMARHVTDYREFREYYTVGETYQIPLQGDQREASIRAVAPSGEALEAAVSAGEAVLALEEPGFYALDGLPDEWTGPRVVAVNHDPAESDLTPMDPEELLLAAREPVEGAAARFVEEIGPEGAEEHQSLWWYILLALFLLLSGETVAANRRRPLEAGTGKGGEE